MGNCSCVPSSIRQRSESECKEYTPIEKSSRTASTIADVPLDDGRRIVGPAEHGKTNDGNSLAVKSKGSRRQRRVSDVQSDGEKSCKRLSIVDDDDTNTDEGFPRNGLNSSPPAYLKEEMSAAPSQAAVMVDTISPALFSLLACKPHRNKATYLGGIRYRHYGSEATLNSLLLSERMEDKRKNHSLVLVVSWQGGGFCESRQAASNLETLNHPLLIEAAETFFVTFAIICDDEPTSDDHNLTTGREEDAPHSFFRSRSSSMTCGDGPHLQIIDPTGSEDTIVSCVLGERWSVGGVSSAMARALRAIGRQVPTYLRFLEQEDCGTLHGGVHCHASSAAFGMTCFTTGEVELSGMEGVIAIKSGRIDGCKCLQVVYNSRILSYGKLVEGALTTTTTTRRSLVVVNKIFYQTMDEKIVASMKIKEAKSSTQLHQLYSQFRLETCHFSKQPLRMTPLRYVPLTDLQAAIANRLVYYGKFNEAIHVLSPRQGIIFMTLQWCHQRFKLRDLIDLPIESSWQHLSDNRIFDTTTQ